MKPIRRGLLLGAVSALLVAPPALAAPEATLVKDIRPHADHVFSRTTAIGPTLANMGGKLFFRAYDGRRKHGTELWVSDGTAAGTTLVKDIRPGRRNSGPDGLVGVGDTLFFTAKDRRHGRELWKSDGTAAGTRRVKDINPGSDSSYPQNITDAQGTIFFEANDGTSGNELWKTDGTRSGTKLVRDIYPGTSGSGPSWLTDVEGTLFFEAFEPIHGRELWKSDGTSTGTELMRERYYGGASWLTHIGPTLFFSAIDSNHGWGLWRSDGTPTGTVLLKDMWPGTPDDSLSKPEWLTTLGSTLFFSGYDPDHGRELWKSNGTRAGTQLLKDIVPGPEDSPPTALTPVGQTMFFVSGSRLWSSDGTAEGTKRVSEAEGAWLLIRVADTLFFTAFERTHGQELWSSDGTEAGTSLVRDIYPGYRDSGDSNINQVTDVDGTLFFTAIDPAHGDGLWKAVP
jgi:ELWxxDGT repeat protein